MHHKRNYFQMKLFLSIFSLATALPNGFQGSVWPKPQTQLNYDVELKVPADFSINVEGSAENCEVIKNAVDRYMHYIFPEANRDKVARKARSFQIPFKSQVKMLRKQILRFQMQYLKII